jgi:hypothetical protein
LIFAFAGLATTTFIISHGTYAGLQIRIPNIYKVVEVTVIGLWLVIILWLLLVVEPHCEGGVVHAHTSTIK